MSEEQSWTAASPATAGSGPTPDEPAAVGGGLRVARALELADWRRRVADLYAEVRATRDPEAGWRRWREGRARLFAGHPQSPLGPAERTPEHLPDYFPYDPSFRITATIEPGPAQTVVLPSSSSGERLTAGRFATAHFQTGGQRCRLALFWLDGYAGGLFVSFRDATSGTATYGSGRYLLDTAKGADLGLEDGALVLDFNLSYQPSCSYDHSWSCPLAPRENWLAIPVEAGERIRL